MTTVLTAQIIYVIILHINDVKGVEMRDIELRRKAYDEMLAWKRDLADRYALLIEGARRVGKTHLIERFVKSEYESYIFIDFSHADKVTRESKRAFTEAANIT